MQHRFRSRFGSTLALVALVSACGSDSTAPPAPAGATAVGGGNLVATVGTPVGTLEIRVVDNAGSPLAGISVTWRAVSGGGSVSPASSTTDASGIAQTTWTLGPTAGAQSATGTVSGLPPVTFNATAEPGPASQVIVTPATLTLNALGATGQFAGTLADAFGNAVAGGAVAWSSSAVGVATIDAAGLAEAVSNGTSTITAAADGFEGTALLTVLQTAAAVTVTSPSTNVEIGKTLQLTAAVSDANGNALADPVVTWSSSNTALATVDETGLVTGVAEGSVTFTATSGSASGTADLTVVLVREPFEPGANLEATGTIDASEVMIPAGVTVTATGPLTINASGNVQIDGSIAGDCVPVTVNGSGTVTVTGVVNNDCSGAIGEESPDLTIVGVGAMSFNGATLTSAGDIALGNDPAALAAAGAAVSALARSEALDPEPCTFSVFGAGISANAGRAGATGVSQGGNGSRGADINVVCTGTLNLFGTNFTTSRGGDGGNAVNAAGSATGGFGGRGGDISIVSQSGMIVVENNNFMTTGHGGKGGDATSDGNPATATGGAGGDGGVFSMAPSTGTGSGSLENSRGNGGDGGTARAFGEFGEDATSSTAATKGGPATAVGGPAGIVPQPDIDPTPGAQGFTLTFNEPEGGKGGDALASGGDGGKGSKQFPTGAMGPDLMAKGGDGGTVLSLSFGARPPGTPGDGGLARFLGGNGGKGWDPCMDQSFLERGGNGGPGGTLSSGNGEGGLGGAEGELSGTPGALLVEDSGNGGDGGDGAPEKSMGGAAGTNGLTPVAGTTPTITDGLAKGMDGELCKFHFNVTITVKSGGDPNGHEEFITLTTVTMITAQLTAPGQIEFTSGSVIWVKTNGAVGTDGTFTTTGVGRVAGFDNVPVTFNGSITLDAEGRVTGITGMLVYDSTNSHLPEQQPPPDGDGQRHNANYNLTGTIKPPV